MFFFSLIKIKGYKYVHFLAEITSTGRFKTEISTYLIADKYFSDI